MVVRLTCLPGLDDAPSQLTQGNGLIQIQDAYQFLERELPTNWIQLNTKLSVKLPQRGNHGTFVAKAKTD